MRASSSTRRPCSFNRSVSARAGSPAARSTSGAPSSQVLDSPLPSLKLAPLYLRAEEKGRDSVQRQSSASG